MIDVLTLLNGMKSSFPEVDRISIILPKAPEGSVLLMWEVNIDGNPYSSVAEFSIEKFSQDNVNLRISVQSKKIRQSYLEITSSSRSASDASDGSDNSDRSDK